MLGQFLSYLRCPDPPLPAFVTVFGLCLLRFNANLATLLVSEAAIECKISAARQFGQFQILKEKKEKKG